MAMVHLRILCPAGEADAVLSELAGRPGALAVTRLPVTSDEDSALVLADLARESVNAALNDLRGRGLLADAMVALEPVETSIGRRTVHAEEHAPGEGDDALIWDELTARTGGESSLTGVYLAFMALACLLGGIGVVTDSPITIVGAMVVGPEFSTLAGIAVGVVRGRWRFARRSAVALVVGFAFGIAVTVALALLARGTGLLHPGDLAGNEVDFIYHPGWYSFITAVIAGCAGTLSLASARTAGLIGVFISVTTIPAAANAGVALALGDRHECTQSLLQLLINIVGILVAGVLTLRVRAHFKH